MRKAEVLTKQERGAGGEAMAGAGDWREAAAHALRAEAARRGFGTPYDVEADSEGLAEALVAALTRWRGVGAEGGTESPAFALPPGPPAELLSARSMRCPACGQTGGRFILALADGRVLAIDGDLTYACPEGEALAETTALCGTCWETAPLGDFRQG
jgi:hypothetical protein